MSHHIYQTRAFIIDSADTGEANKFIAMLTEDLGLIYVAAQGVRLIQSKLRPSIQEMSFSKVSLVRGRELWRLTSAEKLISLADRRIPLAARKIAAEMLLFVRRLVQGEERHDRLFKNILEFFEFLLKNSSFAVKHSSTVVALGKAGILYELGYGSNNSLPVSFMEGSSKITEEKVLLAEQSLKDLENHIRVALESSHL